MKATSKWYKEYEIKKAQRVVHVKCPHAKNGGLDQIFILPNEEQAHVLEQTLLALFEQINELHNRTENI